jgi:hypothetical protein
LGLIPEGGLAIAIVISFGLTGNSPVANSLVTVILLSVLLSDLIAPRLIVTLFGIEDEPHE